MKKSPQRTFAGFTLVELLVSVSIIAVISTLGLVSFQQAGRQGRNSKRKNDLKAVQAALEAYFVDNRSYPTSPANNWCDLTTAACPTLASTSFIPNYMSRLPSDPRSGQANTGSANADCRTTASSNVYQYRSDGTNYKIIAQCTPEGTLLTTDEFYDPARNTWGWQVTNNSNNTSAW